MENHIKAGNLPTAEEFLQEHHQISHFYSDKEEQMVCFSSDVQKAMIEFAKLHVKAALEKASEDAEVEEWAELNGDTGTRVDKKSILNAYPDENVK